MRSRRFLLARTLPAMVPLALLAGCGHKGLVSPHANLRPTIELTRAPYNQSTRFEYSYRMDWLGYDADGRIDHYVYAIDLWIFARADCKQLVDAVLQREWNLPYVPPSASSLAGPASHVLPSASAAAPPAWSPPTVSRGGPATRVTIQGGR